MFFANNRITKETLRKQICLFAKNYGVKKICFNNNAKYVSGSYNCFTKTLYICTNQTKKQMLNTLFHELGHHEAVLKNKWLSYHFNLYETLTYDRMFDIENKIEKIGKQLWNKNVCKKHWGNYKYTYLKSRKNEIEAIFATAK